MRMVLTWLDQLRRTTVEQLPAFCAALVAQAQEIAAAANQWAATDHNGDGTHSEIHLGPIGSQITLAWDGTNLTYEKPDGTTGTIV